MIFRQVGQPGTTEPFIPARGESVTNVSQLMPHQFRLSGFENCVIHLSGPFVRMRDYDNSILTGALVLAYMLPTLVGHIRLKTALATRLFSLLGLP